MTPAKLKHYKRIYRFEPNADIHKLEFKDLHALKERYKALIVSGMSRPLARKQLGLYGPSVAMLAIKDFSDVQKLHVLQDLIAVEISKKVPDRECLRILKKIIDSL